VFARYCGARKSESRSPLPAKENNPLPLRAHRADARSRREIA